MKCLTSGTSAMYGKGQDVALLQVGQSQRQCNATVLTTEAYTALANGTCTPSCPPTLPCPQVCPGGMADLSMSVVVGPE